MSLPHSPLAQQCGEDRLVGVLLNAAEDRLCDINRIGLAALDEEGKLSDRHRTEGKGHGESPVDITQDLPPIISQDQPLHGFSR